jgi:tRNA(Arg) A34 adenosine deaminase TadA
MRTETLVRVARSFIELTPHRCKHFSFACKKNEVYAVGWNQPFKTHPLAKKFGYKFNCIHSELHAILKLNVKPSELRKYTLVNVRLDKQGEVKMSKPCKVCQKLLGVFQFAEVYYSTNLGTFEVM